MAKDGSILKKIRKGLLGVAAGTAAAASLAAGALFDSPAELLAAENDGDDASRKAEIVSVGKRLEPAAGDRAERGSARLADRLRALFLAQPSVVRAVVLLPAWCVGRAGIALLTLLLQALAPVWQLVLGVLPHALLLCLLFALVYKLLFPNRSLKTLFQKRNLIALIAGGLTLSVGDALLRRFVADYAKISVCIRLGLALFVLALLCRRVFGRRKKRGASARADAAS